MKQRQQQQEQQQLVVGRVARFAARFPQQRTN